MCILITDLVWVHKSSMPRILHFLWKEISIQKSSESRIFDDQSPRRFYNAKREFFKSLKKTGEASSNICLPKVIKNAVEMRRKQGKELRRPFIQILNCGWFAVLPFPPLFHWAFLDCKSQRRGLQIPWMTQFWTMLFIGQAGPGQSLCKSSLIIC